MTIEDKNEVKRIIEEHLKYAEHGIYFTRNIVGDEMFEIWRNSTNTVHIDICYHYGYYEVFGLTEKEKEEIEEFYYQLRNDLHNARKAREVNECRSNKIKDSQEPSEVCFYDSTYLNTQINTTKPW